MSLPTKLNYEGKPYTDALEFCKELEAYIGFRLLDPEPTIPEEDMRSIKLSLVYLIAFNRARSQRKPSRILAALNAIKANQEKK